MRDGFERTIRYLRLSVTDLCNYRCTYCMPEGGVSKQTRSDMLSIEELAEIGEAAVRCGVDKIRFTGGEPLVRRGLLTLCRRLSAAPGLRELTLTTNGALLRPMASELRSAGVGRLNVSLDTLRPERFAAITRCGSLEDVLDGLAAAREAGFTGTKLNVVLLGGVNDDEIADLAALTLREDYCVRFIELMPMAVCANFPKERFLSADAVLERLGGALERVGSEGVAELYRLRGARGTVGLIRPMSHAFCAHCDRLRVTADGKLKPCLHSGAELSLRGLHGAALEQALRAGALEKPEGHHLTCGGSDTPRCMYEIGG